VLELQPSVLVDIVPGRQLEYRPRLALRGLSLIVGPYRSGDEHEQHYLDTTGSGAWHAPEDDELRFGKGDRILRSAWLHIPEAHLSAPNVLAPWVTAAREVGLLRLAGAPPNQLDLAYRRILDTRDEALGCVTDLALHVGQERLGLTIAEDVDLLFANGQACGWLLRHPQRYLSDGWQEPPAPPSEESQLAALLADYLELISQKNMAALEAADPEMHASLRALKNRAAHIPASPQRDALLAAIDAQIDLFFADLR